MLQNFCVYKAAKQYIQLNKEHSISYNPTFKVLNTGACSDSSRQSES